MGRIVIFRDGGGGKGYGCGCVLVVLLIVAVVLLVTGGFIGRNIESAIQWFR